MSEPITIHNINGQTLMTQEWYNISVQRRQITIANEDDCFVQAFYDRNGKLHITENVLDNPNRYKAYPGLSKDQVDCFLDLAIQLINELNAATGGDGEQ